MDLKDELKFYFEEVEGMTKRSSLETGFNHSNVTMKELGTRLETIAGYCQGMVRENYVDKIVDNHDKELLDMIDELASELENYVEHHYHNTKQYPSEMRRYERDIEPVRKARLMLSLRVGDKGT